MESLLIKDLLTKKPYYNIGILLMAYKGSPEPLIEKYGERGAFAALKEMMDYSNHLRNVDHQFYPIGVTLSREILRPHYHVASALVAGYKDIYVMAVNEGAEEFGEPWIDNLKHKREVQDFYKSIPSLWNL